MAEHTLYSRTLVEDQQIVGDDQPPTAVVDAIRRVEVSLGMRVGHWRAAGAQVKAGSWLVEAWHNWEAACWVVRAGVVMVTAESGGDREQDPVPGAGRTTFL